MSEEIKKFYEKDIKDLIRTKRHMFKDDEITSDIKDIRIFNEKVICQGKCRTDCLILDRNGTVMGIEIKTERDSTQRLNKQLHYYSLVCKYVYVMCHDKHVPKVEQILKRYKHHHVGIMSYINFKGKPMVGKYKEAKPSPTRSPYHTMNILWKKNLLTILNLIRDPFTYRSGYNYNKNGRFSTSSGDTSHLTHTLKMKKPAIINQIIHYVGIDNTYKLFTRGVIYGYNDRWVVVEEEFFKTMKHGVRVINEERQEKG
ncbi:hypothetical protein CF5_0154 [Staphylococcus phage CF5]|uniref:Uncharacterized protein n=1 Tax=Staphylococcus phage CF5 TaxID=3113739 RepID=A0AAX4J7T0_9CAUD|nr:hypothetical protein CF5_0154 [Staphylococcus phage CF5]